jgi:hypothetical protein
MSNLPNSNSDTGDDNGVRSDRPSTPRWVKVSGIIVIILFLLFVIHRFTGIGGEHGPGRHTPGGDAPPKGDQTPSADHTRSVH